MHTKQCENRPKSGRTSHGRLYVDTYDLYYSDNSGKQRTVDSDSDCGAIVSHETFVIAFA